MIMRILDTFKVRFRQISHINFKIVHLIIFAIKYEVYVINYFLNLIKQNWELLSLENQYWNKIILHQNYFKENPIFQ